MKIFASSRWFAVTIFILIIALFASLAPAQPTDLNDEGLKGRVKRIDDKVAKIKIKSGRSSEGSKRRYRSTVFDKQGRKTYQWLHIEGLSAQEEYYTYPKENRQLRRVIREQPFDRSNEPPRPQFSLTVFRWEPSERTLYESVFISRRSTDLVEEFTIPTQSYRTVFDGSDRVQKRYMQTVSGKVVATDEYRYLNEGPVSERVLIAVGNPLPQRITYEYVLDNTGNWVKRTETKVNAIRGAVPVIEVTYRKIEYY